jgi:hypothetical protein
MPTAPSLDGPAAQRMDGFVHVGRMYDPQLQLVGQFATAGILFLQADIVRRIFLYVLLT